MKLLNTKAEFKAIRTICSPKYRKSSALMMGSVSEDSFYHQPTLEAYHRISKIVKNTGEVPTYDEICSDPVISEDTRRSLTKNKELPVKTKSGTRKLIRTVEKYRKLRGLYFSAEETIRAMQQPKVDLDSLLDQNTSVLTRLRASADKHNQVHTFGHKGTDALFKEALYGKGIPLIPTGFAAWDDLNGGVNSTGVFGLGGPTGGGKSAIALQLMHNMTSRGYDTCFVGLEMTEIETMYRFLSNAGEVPITKFLRKKLTKGERLKVKKGYRKFKNKLKKSKTKFSIWAPDEDVSLEDILFSLKPYGYRVIIIDYISLLEVKSGVDEWKALRDVSRVAKRYANANQTLIILLAQLGDNGNLRYARGVSENCDVLWIWSYTDESRETGLIEFRPVKARNFNPTPFTLLHDYTYMKIGDVDDRTIRRLRDQDDGRGESRREKLNKFERDISVEIDEDD